jgi:hypothetical protein
VQAPDHLEKIDACGLTQLALAKTSAGQELWQHLLGWAFLDCAEVHAPRLARLGHCCVDELMQYGERCHSTDETQALTAAWIPYQFCLLVIANKDYLKHVDPLPPASSGLA